jgi:hypothetical protein
MPNIHQLLMVSLFDLSLKTKTFFSIARSTAAARQGIMPSRRGTVDSSCWILLDFLSGSN